MQIGFANGCFDGMHAGHRHFLLECRKRCDYLIVAVNSDAYCRRVKGPDRPAHSWEERARCVKMLADAVIPFAGHEEALLLEIRPDVVFKGAEYDRGQIAYGAYGLGWKDGAECWIANIHYVERLAGVSTTAMLERQDALETV